ncbi:MAG: zinc-binding alcohol dehydrogenase [bacterium]|nr:zinc-binding alcohol dehydrogenase [bacterium]
MHQIVVNQEGKIAIRQIEPPKLENNRILVKVEYGTISVGTETLMIRAARNNPPQSVIPLGYSEAGTVLEVGTEITNVKPGDRVACYGAPYVHHAEILSVPKHLYCPIPEHVSTRDAAFIAMGTIAIHGVRQSGLRFGESALVVGLGLIGQMVSQVCVAAGVKTIVADLNPERLQLAKQLGADDALNPADDNYLNQIKAYTDGQGVDAVLLCLATNSKKPLEQAFDAVRFRGKIVIVGVLPLEINRDQFFAKEAAVLISRAAGAGRYDPRYEKDGVDYPYGYVRWTEHRNMQEFIRLLSKGLIKVTPLISSEYPLAKIPEVYEQLLTGTQNILGIVIKY